MPPMVLDPADSFPQYFGKYRVDALLGKGGQGAVYNAYDTGLSRPVALKIPDALLAKNLKVREAFLEEGRIGARFKHPNLCGVYESGICDSTPYLALEYIAGATLSEFRKVPWLIPGPTEAVEITMQLAHGMAHYHRHQ